MSTLTRRRPCAALVPLAAVSAIAAATAPAAAADPVIETARVSRTISGPQGAHGTVTAHCPSGSRVVFGGYDSTVSIRPDGSGGGLLATQSRRIGARGWRVSAYKIGDGGSALRLTAVARCGSLFGALNARTATVVAPAAAGGVRMRTASAACPTGRFATSGGFRISIGGAPSSGDGPPPAIVFGSRSSGRSWSVTASRLLPSGTSRLTAYAYCGSERPVARAKSAIFRPGGILRHLDTPPCPWGSLAVGGGFLSHFPMGPAPGVMLPVASSLGTQRRWHVNGIATDRRAFFSAYVYCL